jgi:hypothetical protein
VIPRGQPAVFALANKTAVGQAMRLWGHVAQLPHSMDDGWGPYWRDTILIQPGRSAHVAFVADRQMAARIRDSRSSRRRSGNLVSGGVKRPTLRDTLSETGGVKPLQETAR